MIMPSVSSSVTRIMKASTDGSATCGRCLDARFGWGIAGHVRTAGYISLFYEL